MSVKKYNRFKKLKIKIIKKEERKKWKKKEKRKTNKQQQQNKQENSSELQKPNIEAEVYSNNKKCD